MNLSKTLEEVMVTGGIAALTTTAASAYLGSKEIGSPAAPINAISHIAFGNRACMRDDITLKYTATGLAINALAHAGWAGIQEVVLNRVAPTRPVATVVATGLVITSLAYVVDYVLVPKRFTPGLELRLSKKALAWAYAALAVGLIAGGLMNRRTK